VSIERDDQAQTGSGHTKVQAMNALLDQFR